MNAGRGYAVLVVKSNSLFTFDFPLDISIEHGLSCVAFLICTYDRVDDVDTTVYIQASVRFLTQT